jgi:hypothetical protein
LNPFIRTALPLMLAVSLSATEATTAKCTLPVPDGSDARPSSPNVQGVITEVTGQVVVVRQTSTGRRVRIQLPEKPEIYTAFGGDAGINELTSGQTVSVWFIGCKWPPTANPLSAYFQIYSTNPNDKPK